MIMFLSSLKDVNKKLFLEMCVHLSMSDGELADSEMEVLKAYCKELDLDESLITTSKSLKELIELLKKETNEVEKKIIIMELLALANADGSYVEQEKVDMNFILEGLGMDEDVIKQITYLLVEYENVCEKIKNFLCE